MPKMNLIKNGKLKGKETDKLASIKKLPFSIPAKTPKEVYKIFKFFKAKAPVCTTWILHKKVVWPHLQQFLYWGIPGFILVPLMVVIKLPTLKCLLISLFALLLL